MKNELIWLGVSLAIFACGAPSRSAGPGAFERPLPAAGLEIGYQVDAVRPPASFSLTIPPSGDAELLLLEPPAATRAPRGRFRGPIAAAVRHELERQVRDNRLLDADPGESATAEGSGSISLATPDKRVHLGLASASPALNALRARLDAIVAELGDHPVAAVQAEVRGDRTRTGLALVVDLVHVGSEPLELVLVEGDMTASVVASVTSAGGSSREVVLGGAAMRALVNAGKVRAGITRLGPGERLALPLNAMVEPGAHVDARVSCWYPGVGKSRSSLVLQAAADIR